MLKQRVITATLLVAVLVWALLSVSPWPFLAVTLLLVAAGAWEWSRLNHWSPVACVLSALACAAASAGLWLSGLGQQHLPVVWAVSGVLWVVVGAWLLSRGTAAWLAVPFWLRGLAGPFVMGVAWLALMQARARGVNFLFSVLAIAWVADSTAYFAGRAWGGRWFARKLAPGISPGKTWEGALGGWLGVLISACAWRVLETGAPVDSVSIYGGLNQRGAPVLILGASFLCVMSVVGDLLESLFKRAAGVKDSSRLLPGHGGVLDRLDALLPTLPLALLLTEWAAT